MTTERKRPIPRKIREQAFVDSFDEEIPERYEDVFEADDTAFYGMCR